MYQFFSQNIAYSSCLPVTGFSSFDASRFDCAFYTDKAISGGKLVIDVSYFGWHIHSETHDLCDETSCPVSTGDFVVAHSQVLPGFTPPVSYIFFINIHFLKENC